MQRNHFFDLIVLVFIGLGAAQVVRCGHQPPTAQQPVAQPSRHVETRREKDGSETSKWTLMLAEQAGAIDRLRSDSSRLAHRLAAELSRVKNVQAATVFTTQTPCGDVIEQGVTYHEEAAPGLLGFLKPREARVDIRQFTPGATTLSVQSFAVPSPKPKRWGVGVVAGYGVGPDFKPQPFIGGGITYTFLRW